MAAPVPQSHKALETLAWCKATEAYYARHPKGSLPEHRCKKDKSKLNDFLEGDAAAYKAPSPQDEINAIWHAGWLLREYFGGRTKSLSPELADDLEGLPSTCPERFKAIYGYDPATLSGSDLDLFRLHMQIWREELAAARLGQKMVKDQEVAYGELNLRFKSIRPGEAEWHALLSRIFPLTFASSEWAPPIQPKSQDEKRSAAFSSNAQEVLVRRAMKRGKSGRSGRASSRKAAAGQPMIWTKYGWRLRTKTKWHGRRGHISQIKNS